MKNIIVVKYFTRSYYGNPSNLVRLPKKNEEKYRFY